MYTKYMWVIPDKIYRVAVESPKLSYSASGGINVRIDYAKHGDPLYAFIWEDGATQGWAVKPSSNGISKKQVPLHLIMDLENSDGGSQAALNRIFA
jgi:hypothetical protein